MSLTSICGSLAVPQVSSDNWRTCHRDVTGDKGMSVSQVCPGWCGFCYSNVKGRGRHKGHARYRAAPTKRRSDEMRKPVNDRPAGDSDATLRIDTDGLLARRAPTVLQWLSDDRWDDGSARQPSTLLVFAEDGCLKACLNDRDGSRSCLLYT